MTLVLAGGLSAWIRMLVRASVADFLNVFTQKANYVRYSCVYADRSSHLSVCVSPQRCIFVEHISQIYCAFACKRNCVLCRMNE